MRQGIFETGDLPTLAMFDRAHELGRIKQRIAGSGVKTCKAAAKLLHRQLARFQVSAVDVGDLDLAARRGAHRRQPCCR
jgi:hypothetical protein